MGRINILQGKIQDTVKALENLKSKTGQKDVQSNKGEYDRLFKKLKVLQAEFKNLGKESLITKVLLGSGGFVYYTGLDTIETKELIRRKGLDYISIEEIKPGIIMH